MTSECPGKEKCNWWTLLDEIKEQFKKDLRKHREPTYVLSDLFMQSAFKVCKRHMEVER